MSPSSTTPAEQLEVLRVVIEGAFARRASLTSDEIEGSTRPAVEQVMEGPDSGEQRIAELHRNGGWMVNEWLRKTGLLYFGTKEMELIEADPAPFWVKVPARIAVFDDPAFRELGA